MRTVTISNEELTALKVKNIHLQCDKDGLLARVKQLEILAAGLAYQLDHKAPK